MNTTKNNDEAIEIRLYTSQVRERPGEQKKIHGDIAAQEDGKDSQDTFWRYEEGRHAL